MTDTYTPIDRLTLQSVGSNPNTWGLIVNSVWALVEQNTDGYQTVDYGTAVAGSTITASVNNGATDQARTQITQFTGTPSSACTYVLPSTSWHRSFKNTTGQNVIITGASSTQTVIMPTGTSRTCFCDGTDVFVSDSAPITGFTSVIQQFFVSSGTYTPTAGMKYCVVQLVGGGAGGGNFPSVYAGGGGGAGQYAEATWTAGTIGASQSVTIGAGGAENTNGGNTSFGTLMTSNGGIAPTSGGLTGGGGAGGSGGFSSGGYHANGGDGFPAATEFINFSATTYTFWGGSGGSSYWGGGGRGGQGNLDPGHPGLAYGSGGGGIGYFNNSFSTNAGIGAAGFVLVTEFI